MTELITRLECWLIYIGASLPPLKTVDIKSAFTCCIKLSM